VDELLLSGEERDRLQVLQAAKKGQITQGQAAAELKLSRRWVKKLIQRLREQGDRGVLHGLKGRVSNRRIGEEAQKKAVELIRSRYPDYGPTQAAEMLAEQHGIEVSRETVRTWMRAAKLWRAKRAQVHKVHGWRPRRARRGELVQWDTSEHDWLEGRGPKLYLIAMIDDATNELTARFALSDSTAENMRLLWLYLERHGRPGEFYTDKASLFHINRRLHYNKHLPEEPGKTQIGRALEELRIGWIAAHSPQAKGRVERCFGTLQDRLVKALRRADIQSAEAANEFLDQVYLEEWNRRFQRAPACSTDAHKPLRKDQQLASILSYVEERTVTNDYTISWLGQHYQVPLALARPRLRKARVRVEQRLDGRMVACFEGRTLPLQACQPKQPITEVAGSKNKPVARRPGKPNREWMKHFVVGDPEKCAERKIAQSSPAGSP